MFLWYDDYHRVFALVLTDLMNAAQWQAGCLSLVTIRGRNQEFSGAVHPNGRLPSFANDRLFRLHEIANGLF
jgi:hypothetical protein